MRFLSTWIVLILILSFFGIGKALYQEDNTRDIYNYTENKMDWKNVTGDTYSINKFNITHEMKQSEVNMIHLKRVVFRGIDNLGFIITEVARWGIEWGFNKPDWNYLWFARILIYIIVGLYLIALIQVIFPLGALIYFSFIGIKKLVVWFKYKISKLKRKKT